MESPNSHEVTMAELSLVLIARLILAAGTSAAVFAYLADRLVS